MQKLQSLVFPLLSLCVKAGDVITEHYAQTLPTSYSTKKDATPLTQADLASHALIETGLRGLTDDLPVLSEESAPDVARERWHWPRFWLVDPLDGTREFLDRTGEFTINIALIEHYRPTLGLLYLPLERRAYVGIPGRLSCCYQQSASGQWSSRQTATRSLDEAPALTVLVSRRPVSADLQRCLDALGQGRERMQLIRSGSAAKFCQLVEGKADLYPRFSPCSEWDIAAGDAVLEAAGGALLGLDGKPMLYNQRQTLLSPDFYAFADPGHELWQQLPRSR